MVSMPRSSSEARSAHPAGHRNAARWRQRRSPWRVPVVPQRSDADRGAQREHERRPPAPPASAERHVRAVNACGTARARRARASLRPRTRTRPAAEPRSARPAGTRPRRRPAAARSWPRRPRTAGRARSRRRCIGIADAVPSGTFCSAIASRTNRPSPSARTQGGADREPLGQAVDESTPNTSSERRTPAPRSAPTCTSRRASARRATSRKSTPASRPPHDRSAGPLVERRREQADDRRNRHHARRDAPQNGRSPSARSPSANTGHGAERPWPARCPRRRARAGSALPLAAAGPARLEQCEQLGQERHARVRAQAGVHEGRVGELRQRGLEVGARRRPARPASAGMPTVAEQLVDRPNRRSRAASSPRPAEPVHPGHLGVLVGRDVGRCSPAPA